MMVRQMIVFAAATTLAAFAFAQDTVSSVFSPDGRNEIRFDRKSISYKVFRDGVLVVADTPVSMKIAGKELSDGAKFKSFVKGSLSGTVGTPVYKKSSINLAANTLFADYGDWGIRLAARNDGVA